jgi:Periplasmic copper-binding protein (NosD)
MSRYFTITLAVICVLAGHMTSATGAGLPIAYVSAGGLDTADCSSTRVLNAGANGPCRNFARALSQVQDGGAIVCVGPGYFQQMTITTSVTIDCRAGGGAFNTVSIVVNAPGKKVRFRNLAVNAVSLIVNPIIINSADSVEFDNVTISGSTGTAIQDTRPGPAKLSIRNSTIVGNTDNAAAGIVVAPQNGVATLSAVLDNVSVRSSGYGLAVGNGARVMVTHSTFTQNATAGIEVDQGGIVDINDTLISSNTTGIIASNGSSVALSNSGINSSNTGISGPTRSYGNNRFFANAISDGTPPTPAGAASSENGLR